MMKQKKEIKKENPIFNGIESWGLQLNSFTIWPIVSYYFIKMYFLRFLNALRHMARRGASRNNIIEEIPQKEH